MRLVNKLIYGKELILDLHNCNPSTFRRSIIGEFLSKCCEIMEVQQCELHFWDDEGLPEEECQTDPKTKGTTAIQFLLKSNITIHALDLLRSVYINAFSCGKFDFNTSLSIQILAKETFGGEIVQNVLMDRL